MQSIVERDTKEIFNRIEYVVACVGAFAQRHYDRKEKLPDENPTIGLLLCTAKNDTLVKMTLPSDNSTIVASKYQLYMPTEQQLIAEVERVRKEWEEAR